MAKGKFDNTFQKLKMPSIDRISANWWYSVGCGMRGTKTITPIKIDSMKNIDLMTI